MAREGSSEKRRVLLRELTEHFFGAPVRSRAEDEHYGAILERLADDMGEAVRTELAERFAPESSAPRGLIRRLARDASDIVAAPVLAASPLLDEQELMRAVRGGRQARLRAVSSRSTVSEALSAEIVAAGDDETLGVLLRNDGACLSRADSETAVDRARTNPALHEAVVGRRSLPADLLNEMYFVVEARLRRQILDQNARMDPVLLENALEAGRARVASADGVLPDDYAEQFAYVQELKVAGQLTPPVLARFLRSGGRTAFLIALAELADIEFQTARMIVERRQMDALAVVCKAADLDRSLFLTYAVVLLNREEDAMGRGREYARHYVDLPRETALRTLRFWRLRRQAA